MTVTMDDPLERARLLGRFPNCPYARTCDAAIREKVGPWHFCQCHHGRELDDPDFAHEEMKELALRFSS